MAAAVGERVADLPDDQWRRLAGHLSDRAEDRPGLDEVLLTLDSQHGSERGDLDVPESESSRVDAAVRKAAKALQYRDLLAPHDFDSLYAAFASIIPVETLEDYDVVGKAVGLDGDGLLDPLLRMVWRRFRPRARQR